MPDEQLTTPVDVITQHCRYSGLVVNRGYRVSDILSNPSTDVLEMRETVTSVVGARSSDVRWKQIYLRKSDILLVIPKGSYEAPARRYNNYVEKDRYGTMIVLPGLVLSGVVHLSSHASPSILLDKNSPLPGFIGLADVTIHTPTRGLGPSHHEAIILRRQSIESVQITAQPLSKQDRVAEAAETEVPSALSFAE